MSQSDLPTTKASRSSIWSRTAATSGRNFEPLGRRNQERKCASGARRRPADDLCISPIFAHEGDSARWQIEPSRPQHQAS
jgi:hypothetical protein